MVASNNKIKISGFFFIFYLYVTVITAQAMGHVPCNGPYFSKKISTQEMIIIIQNHAIWLQKHKNDWITDEEVNLCGADLSKLDLKNMNLSRMDLSLLNLSEANLQGANLSNANLGNSKLEKTIFREATLSYAILSYSDLTEADLSRANLNNAWLMNANLTRANLTNANASETVFALANMRGAYLVEVNLTGAMLIWADITGSWFYPSAIGDAAGFLSIRGLSKIIITKVSPIVELRKKMKEAGFTFEEKSLTSALRKYQLLQPIITSPVFNPEYWFEGLFLGGFLTDFGAFPEGAFDALLILIFAFFCLYLFALKWPRPKAGIWRLWPADRIIKEINKPDKELVKWDGFFRTVWIAFYFSILSAFRFGWRDLNLTNWIVRIQHREYILRATGWVRMVSGIQSLISLYLVALALLTYFGRPFE